MKKKITTFMALMASLLISARCFAQDSLVPFDAHTSIWGGMFAPQSPEAMAITRYGTITEAVWQHGNITYDPIRCLTFSYILLGQPYAVSDSSAKEIQTTAGVNLIDFGARLYDDRICRWTSQDPLAAKYPAFSPYAYCAGDPVGVMDNDGAKLIQHLDEELNGAVSQLRDSLRLGRKPKEVLFLCCCILDLEPEMIAEIMDTSKANVYEKRSRLRARVRELGDPVMDVLIAKNTTV